MKNFLIIMFFLSNAILAGEAPAPLDLSKVLGMPPVGLNDRWGKPFLSDPPNKTADWLVQGWGLTLKSDGKKVMWIHALANDEETKTPKDFPEAMKLFGLTKENGWILGEIHNKGLAKVLYLTHLNQGVFTVLCLPDDERGMTSLIFKHTQFKYP
jgi:hypothetical protein